MSAADVEKVGRLEAHLRDMEQVPIQTSHHFTPACMREPCASRRASSSPGADPHPDHADRIRARNRIHRRRATDLCGYHVIPASAGRKQVFVAHADTDLTMLFPSHAATVEDAEAGIHRRDRAADVAPATRQSDHHHRRLIMSGVTAASVAAYASLAAAAVGAYSAIQQGEQQKDWATIRRHRPKPTPRPRRAPPRCMPKRFAKWPASKPARPTLHWPGLVSRSEKERR